MYGKLYTEKEKSLYDASNINITNIGPVINYDNKPDEYDSISDKFKKIEEYYKKNDPKFIPCCKHGRKCMGYEMNLVKISEDKLNKIKKDDESCTIETIKNKNETLVSCVMRENISKKDKTREVKFSVPTVNPKYSKYSEYLSAVLLFEHSCLTSKYLNYVNKIYKEIDDETVEEESVSFDSYSYEELDYAFEAKQPNRHKTKMDIADYKNKVEDNRGNRSNIGGLVLGGLALSTIFPASAALAIASGIGISKIDNASRTNRIKYKLNELDKFFKTNNKKFISWSDLNKKVYKVSDICDDEQAKKIRKAYGLFTSYITYCYKDKLVVSSFMPESTGRSLIRFKSSKPYVSNVVDKSLKVGHNTYDLNMYYSARILNSCNYGNDYYDGWVKKTYDEIQISDNNQSKSTTESYENNYNETIYTEKTTRHKKVEELLDKIEESDVTVDKKKKAKEYITNHSDDINKMCDLMDKDNKSITAGDVAWIIVYILALFPLIIGGLEAILILFILSCLRKVISNSNRIDNEEIRGKLKLISKKLESVDTKDLSNKEKADLEKMKIKLKKVIKDEE